MAKDEGPPRAAFETLCAGCLPERLERELQSIFDNIADDNTEAKAARELHVVFKWKPNMDRDAAGVSVVFKKKLAPMIAAEGQVFLRIAPDGTQIGIPDMPPEQGDLFPAKAPTLTKVERTGTNG